MARTHLTGILAIQDKMFNSLGNHWTTLVNRTRCTCRAPIVVHLSDTFFSILNLFISLRDRQRIHQAGDNYG